MVQRTLAADVTTTPHAFGASLLFDTCTGISRPETAARPSPSHVAPSPERVPDAASCSFEDERSKSLREIGKDLSRFSTARKNRKIKINVRKKKKIPNAWENSGLQLHVNIALILDLITLRHLRVRLAKSIHERVSRRNKRDGAFQKERYSSRSRRAIMAASLQVSVSAS